MTIRKNQNNQNNLEKESESWRYHAPWLQIILQGCDNQDNMLLAQIRHISVE